MGFNSGFKGLNNNNNINNNNNNSGFASPHFFLSFSYFFWLTNGRPHPTHVLYNPSIRSHCQKCRLFYEVQKAGTCGFPKLLLRDTVTKEFKNPLKQGLTRDNREELYLYLPCAFLDPLKTFQISNLVCDSVLPGDMIFC